MHLFRRSARSRILVKAYGRDSLLLQLNPVMAGILAGLGLRVGLRSDAQVLADMQKDVLAMAERGYRVVSADERALPVLGLPGRAATWYRVTYELVGPERGNT